MVGKIMPSHSFFHILNNFENVKFLKSKLSNSFYLIIKDLITLPTENISRYP